MGRHPSFSVVIPTYNRAHLLPATLDTVLAQTYREFEVIVVDNCSTDDTEAAIAPHLRSGRVRFIRHDRDYERAKSRNTAMAAAEGNFVTFIDSDDRMYPRNLEDAARFAADHPELKCFHNLYELIDEQGTVVYRYHFPSLKNRWKAIANGNFMACIGDFLDRDLYRRYEFDTDPALTGSEDWDFWLRVLADHPVGRINRINNGIVQHCDRTVNTQSHASVLAGLERVVAKFRADPHLSAVYAKYLDRIHASALLYMAVLANAERSRRESLRWLAKAFSVDPTVVATARFRRSLLRAGLNLVWPRG